MAKTNIARKARLTEANDAGTPVRSIDDEQKLRRVVLASMLWEDQFYVDGMSTADLIKRLVATVDPTFVSHLAIAARSNFKLRHVPLLLTRELARRRALKADVLNAVIQRPDEMSEFLSLYWKDGKTPISNQVKLGLGKALNKFNEYQLAKWDSNSSAIRLRDVLFLTHAKPESKEKAELFRRLANQELKVPDTWEVALSGGADKKETFERLMAEGKLGALAFLRNLRNMTQAGVDRKTLLAYGAQTKVDRVLPFRYLAAVKHVPEFQNMLEQMMLRSLESHEKLKGRTVLVVDVSGSMRSGMVSSKSELNRIDAAVALAMLAREICEDVTIYATAGSDYTRTQATAEVKPHRGFALMNEIHSQMSKLGGGGIFLVQCMDWIKGYEASKGYGQPDRVIVFTDEQDTGGRGFEPHKAVRLAPEGRNYIVNVGAYQNGVNSAEWETVTGFSEAVIDYIQALEADNQAMSQSDFRVA